MCKKYSKEWIIKKKEENRKKRRRRKVIVRVTKIAIAGALVGSFIHGFYSGTQYAKTHPKTHKCIIENDLGYVGKEEQIRLEKKFGEYK